MRPLLVILLVSASAPLGAQQTQPLADATINRVTELIEARMQEAGIPGLSAAIATDNTLRWASGFGPQDVENSVEAHADTKYRTASIAKAITAVAVMSLTEDGELDLDHPVQRYCPGYPEKRWPVTTRQLLGHLGGVRHYKTRAETTVTQHYTSLTAALDVFSDDPLLHEPGTKYLYSTFGYNLIGCVAEGAASKKFMEILQQRVFEPAKMQDTVADNHFAIIPNRTRGYRRSGSLVPGRNGKLLNAMMHDTSMKIPGGGLLSTSPDLVRFAVALNSGKLLKDTTRTEMWTAQETTDGRKTTYGLGWGVGSVRGMRVVSHTGGQAGTSTILVLAPEHGTAIALMCNLRGAGLRDLANGILTTLHPQREESP